MAKKNGFLRAGWSALLVGLGVVGVGLLQYNRIMPFASDFFFGLYQDTVVGGSLLALVGVVLLIAKVRIS